MTDLRQEVYEFCNGRRLRLNKDLGQHYLINQTILDQIIETANIKETDHVVEIGAGIGILTRELLKKTPQVTAIEIEERIIPHLQLFLSLYSENERLPTIIQKNALEVEMPTLPYKIVANIPYHITSPLLRHCFFESPVAPTSLTLLIQREVAEKICDKKNASLLSVIVRLFGEPSIVCNVPPNDFLPPPKVDSAVIHIACFSEPKANQAAIETIMKLAKLAFSQKRKMLRNTFGTLPNGLELLQKCNIEPTRRPQTITIDEWLQLANAVHK